MNDTPELPFHEFQEFVHLGLANSEREYTLTFLDDERFIQQIIVNSKIRGVITKEDFVEKIRARRRDIQVFAHIEPRLRFYQLYNHRAREKSIQHEPTFIDESARVHHRAHVADVGVVIDAGVVIEPGVCVLPGVRIGKNSVIRAGSTIGVEGFEHKRTSQGLLSVIHDGLVCIGEEVEIGANNTIAKGLMGRDTLVGNWTKTDCLVHIAHGVHIGQRCLIPASAMIAGSVTIGDDVWIGPNATISSQVHIDNQAVITLGAVVVRDVEAKSRVSGNFAVEHTSFIRAAKRVSQLLNHKK